MPTPPMKISVLAENLRVVKKYVGRGYPAKVPVGSREVSAERMAWEELGIRRETFYSRMKKAKEFGLSLDNIPEEHTVVIPDDSDRPCPIDILARSMEINERYIAKKRLKPVVLPVPPKPFAIGFVGDPHLSNAGCNLRALKDDLALLRDSGTRAVQMGDLLDNFHKIGKLAEKEAQNRISLQEGLSLAEWLVAESGVKWDGHVLGNHDAWLGFEGQQLIGYWVARAKSRLFDWNARFIYKWGDSSHEQFTVAASHDFKGHSQYNPTHGPGKMALWDGTADAYVAAHRHEHAEAKVANGWRGKTYQLVRVRGYKDHDSYAAGRAQFPSYHGMEGRSALIVVNPLSTTHDGRQRVFMDLDDGLFHHAELLKRYGF